MNEGARTRPARREMLGACLLGVALFLIPLAIDLARSV